VAVEQADIVEEVGIEFGVEAPGIGRVRQISLCHALFALQTKTPPLPAGPLLVDSFKFDQRNAKNLGVNLAWL
jgi:hypothetical protein